MHTLHIHIRYIKDTRSSSAIRPPSMGVGQRLRRRLVLHPEARHPRQPSRPRQPHHQRHQRQPRRDNQNNLSRRKRVLGASACAVPVVWISVWSMYQLCIRRVSHTSDLYQNCIRLAVAERRIVACIVRVYNTYRYSIIVSLDAWISIHDSIVYHGAYMV